MVSRKQSYGWSEITAEELKKIPLPDRFLCRECKKFKPLPQYSNKQLNEYRFKVHTNQRVTNITAALRCRNCTGGQTEELLCTGPCGLWKSLEDFSKNQRRRPENAWCISCIQWKEANEPGVIPAAPPNNLLSPDEEKEVVETETAFGSYMIDSIEGEADSDDEDIGFIYNSMANTSIADGDMAGSNERRYKLLGPNTISAALPGYLSRHKKITNFLDTKSNLSNPYDTRSEYIDEENKRQSAVTKSENNPPDTGSKFGVQPYSGSGATGGAVVNEKRPKASVAYNAWDNVGKMHSQYRVPSQTTVLAGSIGLQSWPDGQSRFSGHNKQTPAVGHPSDTPPSGPDKGPLPSEKVGAWAKQPSTRNPPPQFPPLSRPITQNIYDDDDDSPDEM